jgi:hypothetical protein
MVAATVDEAMWGFVGLLGVCCCLFDDLFSFLLGKAIFIDCYYYQSMNWGRGVIIYYPPLCSQFDFISFFSVMASFAPQRGKLPAQGRAELFAYRDEEGI